MHMQHQTEAALLSYISQNIGYLGPIMDVENISLLQLFDDRPENAQINGPLHSPGRPVKCRMHLVAAIPIGQTKKSLCRISPGIVK